MNQKRLVLVIDDNEEFLQNFRLFTREDYDILCATTCQEGLTQIRMQDPDVVLLDLYIEAEQDGLMLLRKIKQYDPDLPVIIITDYAGYESAVEAMQIGAVYYTQKSPDLSTLKAVIDQQIQNLPYRRLYREEQIKRVGQIIGSSEATQKIRERIAQCARVDIPVLITGESGTGKELVANAIHRQSSRAAHAMCTINCSTLNPSLFESEFFGHEKGAFTGAVKRKRGKIEMAHNGTLFLDEIADLPWESQSKILHAIEYRRFTRLGGLENMEVNVRYIAATNRNLKECVEQGTFREDLYYRLNVLNIYIPPLRERKEDIPELIYHYLELSCKELRKPVPKIPQIVMDYWISYPWPGNIRELKHRMMQVAFETEGSVISPGVAGKIVEQDGIGDMYQKLLTLPYQKAKKMLLDRFQQDYIQAALRRHGNNITKAADEMGVNRSTVYRVLKGRNDTSE